MEYTIKKTPKIKQIFHKYHDKAADFFLSAILWLAKTTKSQFLAKYIESSTKKKMQRLQQEIIRQRWDLVTLEKAQKAIRNQ